MVKVDTQERRALAHRFASLAYAVEGIVEVRLTSDQEPLVVTALARDTDLERDLLLQRRFIELAREAPDVSWSLRTRIYDRADPEHDGELLPK